MASDSPLGITRLDDSGGFGVRVAGLEDRHLDDPVICEQLRALWIQEGLIVFADLYGRDMLVRLSSVFGDLMESLVKEVASADDPTITDIRFNPDTGWLMELDGETIGSWQAWHIDGIYDKNPNRGGILMPVVMTSRGGETGFVDQIGAYDALPEDLKREIEGLSVTYRLDPVSAFERPRFGQQRIKTIRYSAGVMALNSRLDDYPPMTHPLVHVQRETGRKALCVCPSYAVSIVGMDSERSDALLRRLIAHCTAEERAYYHRYQPGDMILWDNWRIIHRAAGSPSDELRVMERTTIAADGLMDEMTA